jgi:hypothetical protein
MKHIIGDTLWIMTSNKAQRGIVIGRQYTQLESSEDETYLLRYSDGDVHWHHSDLLFDSREALVASIS